jgi:predicted Zn-dependent protease
MKKYAIVSIILIVLASLMFTGFQCGSAESTSAKLYIKNNDFAKAEGALMKDLEKNPENAESWYTLARVRHELKNYKGMLEAYDRCLALPGGKDYEKTIADEKKSIWGNILNEGVGAYNQSTKVSPDSSKVFIAKAIDLYKTAILINPDSAVTYQNLAIGYHVQGNADEEIAALKKSLEHKKDPQFYGYLVNAYVTKAEEAKKANNKADADANFGNAITALNDARAADPGNQELLSTLINVYIEAGRTSEALPFIKEAVDKDPSNKVFQNDLGLLLMQTNDLKGAVDHFNAAVAADSSFLDGLRNGSIAAMKLGQKMKDDAADSKTADKSYQDKFKQAVTLIKKYNSIKDGDPDMYEALATAYGGAGMNKEAQAALKKADDLRKK